MYSNRGQTPSITTHTTRSNINTLMFLHGKTPMGKHPHPNQHGHLEQFINAKENITERFTRDFLTIDHRK
jgi:hypothetical protein